MDISFDYFGMPEDPSFILCNPGKEELYSLGTIYDRKYSPRFNSMGEITFTAPAVIDGVDVDYYNYLTYRRLVYIVDFGYFMITESPEVNDGVIKEKRITAKSLEVEFAIKDISKFSGTYKFYDPVSPDGTLIDTILSYMPNWSVGDIDTALAVLYRTFDVSDSSIYDFLMSEVAEAYQCVFVFNSINRTIDAHATDNATTETDIFLSFDNLIEKIDIDEITEELITSLKVFGGGDLSINQVNPLGGDSIYDFSYYKTTNWMSQSLVDAITAWETVVDNNQSNYATLLTSLLSYNGILITQNSELTTLAGEYTALEGVQSVRIQQGLDLDDINIELVAKQAEIDSKNGEITSTELSIVSVNSQLSTINTNVSFDTNFTEAQQLELDPFIVGNTYQNDNFIQTDSMTLVEIQAMAQELYDQAVVVLDKVSQPRYEFSMDAINFVMLEDFETFTEELELGSVVTLELTEGTYIYPALLGIDLNFDDSTQFKLIFGNRLRLDDGSFRYTDLFNNTVKSSIKSSFESQQWSNFESNYKDDVSTFMDSALDAGTNNVISGSAQDVIIDQNGIRLRKSNGSGGYENEQVWMNNGIIAFTEDKWATSSLIIGQVTTGSATSYGIVGDTIVGNLVASNQLTITNEANTFTVDALGATLTDATLTIEQTNAKIYIDPANGIQIDKYIGGAFDKTVFSVDTAGNAIFAGNLSGANGTFSGVLSAATGTFSGDISGASGTFEGTVSAERLLGLVSYSQLTDIPADKITSSTMSGDRVSGGTITWPGVSFGINYTGGAYVEASGGFAVYVGGVPSLIVYPTQVRIKTLFVTDKSDFYGSATFHSSVSFGALSCTSLSTGTVYCSGLVVGGSSGGSGTIKYTDWYGINRTAVFSRGLYLYTY